MSLRARGELTRPCSSGDALVMPRFIPLLTMSLLTGFTLFAACTEEKDQANPTSSSVAAVGPSTGAGDPVCTGNTPDGVCTLLAAAGDTHRCLACQQAS